MATTTALATVWLRRLVLALLGMEPYWSNWYDNPYYGYGYGNPYGYGAYNNPPDYSSSTAYADPNSAPAPAPRQVGSLRIKAKPANAQVYIDGVLVGNVDDFDGLTNHLELDAGPHQMQIKAEGYRPLHQ